MTQITRERISQLANKVRINNNVGDDSKFDIYKVVENLGGKISESDDFDLLTYGKINKEDDSFRITINKKDSESQKRFTIAHEIGHLYLHLGFGGGMKSRWNNLQCEFEDNPMFHRASVCYPQGYTEADCEANAFANDFLMPKELFDKAIKDLREGNGINPEKLAMHFALSREAVIKRGELLGYF